MNTLPRSLHHDAIFDRASLRAVLISELAKTLGVDGAAIDPTRNFDDYGLDSIDAVLATGTLNDRLKIDLPPEFLLLHRTIDEVVEHIAGMDSFREKVGTATSGTAQPVFLIQGGGGNGRMPRLASHCDSTTSFALVSLGEWREWAAKRWTLDDLVASVCDQIEARCPNGDLRLAGYSQGGQLAFAVAIALSQKGRTISSLNLFDAFAYIPNITQPLFIFRKLARIGTAFAKGLKREPGVKTSTRRTRIRRGRIWVSLLSRPYRRIKNPDTARRYVLTIARWFPFLFRGHGGTYLNNMMQLQVLGDMLRVWSDANPGAYLDAPIILFKSQEDGHPDRGWQSRCVRLRIVPVEGGHLDMFDRQYIQDLARKFSKELRRRP